jgi:hypothetical protein
MEMLRVFDAQAAVGRAIFFFESGIQIEDRAVGAIADGVDRNLKSSFVGLV